MDEEKELLYFIDNITMKNSVGYFIKISGTTYQGSFFNQSTECFSFFVESLKEIPSKYIHYIVKNIDVIQPTKKEVKTLKNFYQNVKNIPCILELKIESKEE